MLEFAVRLSWIFIGVYAVTGAIMALAMHLRGLAAIDPNADGASIGFRICVTPGLIALWPLMIWKWRGALGGRDPAGAPDKPITSRGLRAVHRLTVQGLAALLAVVLIALVIPLAVARMTRRPPYARADSAYEVVEPSPVGRTVGLWEFGAPFDGLPIRARILEEEGGQVLLEISVREDLERPSLVLMWNPTDEPANLKNAVFLGALWGPGIRRYAVPTSAVTGGQFIIYSMADSEVVAAGAITRNGALADGP